MAHVVLASGSAIRAHLLRQIGLRFEVVRPKVDEQAVKEAMQHERARARDIADALAELKAIKVSASNPGALVIGSDQVLVHEGQIFNKPETRKDAEDQLAELSGKEHRLLTAAVIAEDGQPQWRVIGEARLTMKALTDQFIARYLDRNWPDVSDSVGAYKLEAEGARLFSRITGNHFTILGLPLLELCGYLELRGVFEDEA